MQDNAGLPSEALALLLSVAQARIAAEIPAGFQTGNSADFFPAILPRISSESCVKFLLKTTLAISSEISQKNFLGIFTQSFPCVSPSTSTAIP